MKTKINKTIVCAVICPHCKDKIYSRARHDFHYCTCGKTAIDGGFDYVRVAWDKIHPKQVKLKINASRKELYDDWNTRKDKFGLIPFKTIKK
jgi:ribosomal protein L37AE/L43A